MSLYSRFILPRVVHSACQNRPVRRQRDKIVPRASGRVLEIGFGSGLNLGHYNEDEIEKLWALEPASEMLALAQPAIRDVRFPVEALVAPAEAIPLEDSCVDTALVTYSLCTIPDVPAALAEMRRVLKPGGEVLFCEHGAAPDESILRWQRRLNPVWRRLAGGCHLDRDIPSLLREAGLEIESLETMYLPGWRPATFNIWGTARSGAR